MSVSDAKRPKDLEAKNPSEEAIDLKCRCAALRTPLLPAASSNIACTTLSVKRGSKDLLT
jgi:hypothetical protein